MTALHGDGFVLEPICVSHAKGLFPVLSEPGLYQFIENPPPKTEEDLELRFKRWQAGASPDGSELWLNWAIRLDNQELVGHVQATVLSGATSWVAYMLSQRHWGKGLGRAATSLMIQHLISQHRCQTLLACVEQANQRSIALLQALSFVRGAPAEHAAHQLSDSEALFVYRAE